MILGYWLCGAVWSRLPTSDEGKLIGVHMAVSIRDSSGLEFWAFDAGQRILPGWVLIFFWRTIAYFYTNNYSFSSFLSIRMRICIMHVAPPATWAQKAFGASMILGSYDILH